MLSTDWAEQEGEINTSFRRTVSPRILVHLFVMTSFIEMVMNSWTHSIAPTPFLTEYGADPQNRIEIDPDEVFCFFISH